MTDLFDYIAWRGDIPFSQVGVTPVDALIFSAFVYMDFGGLVPEDLNGPVPLAQAAEAFLSQPERVEWVRNKHDLRLARAMALAPRFRELELCFYRSQLIPQEQTQFAAMAFLLDDGSAFLAFRGTDASLVGWKEDFNMSFQDAVPAQLKAHQFTEAFAALCPRPLRLGGHSKGGNLAVFAAARCAPYFQDRILAVYNNDGPGFTEYLMGDPGYRRMVPKIHTYIPQSSVVGMLLEHEEPYSVVRSDQVGIMQHELFSWAVLGGDFVHLEEVTSESKLLDRAVKTWIASMSKQERSDFVDAVFQVLSAGGAASVRDLMQPQNLKALVHTLSTDDQTRKLLTGELWELLRSFRESTRALPQ